MGWADCGTDSNGRHIGYAFEATCDYEGCEEKIDRGLSFVCGDMHGEDEVSCEKYFCGEHRKNYIEHCGKEFQICDSCKDILLGTGEYIEDEEDGIIREKAINFG